jgi:hypothetical protein
MEKTEEEKNIYENKIIHYTKTVGSKHVHFVFAV